MTDATERPTDADSAHPDDTAAGRPDADAWARACQEDLAAERERRRERDGAPSSHATEELRRLADAVADKLAEFSAPFAGAAAQGAAQRLIAQAREAVEPVIERNPRVFDHLAAAGQELLVAYRVATEGDQEQRRPRSGTERSGRVGEQGSEPGSAGTESTGRD